MRFRLVLAKVKDANGKPCWKGYRRHPTIKTGPGSCVKAAEYKGRKVKLRKPVRTPNGPKKFSVYVKDPKTGNVKKVNFGDPNMKIRKSDPKARKSFRARHGCDTGKHDDPTKAGYWSCRKW